MSLEEIEEVVIQCLKENLELSGEPVPTITKQTKPASDLSGFDSLRTIETLINIEAKLGCDLPHDKIITDKKFEDATVSSIAIAIDKLTKDLAQ